MMYPGMMHWWKSHQGDHCAAYAGCGTQRHDRHERWERWHAAPGDGNDFGGAFGVRRPLRFLAYKLGLRDEQVAAMARILGEVKTERAQAEVDSRRTMAVLADAIAAATFDPVRAAEGAHLRVRSAERLRDVLVGALRDIHALLDPDQRARLAYMIRTGTLTL